LIHRQHAESSLTMKTAKPFPQHHTRLTFAYGTEKAYSFGKNNIHFD